MIGSIRVVRELVEEEGGGEEEQEEDAVVDGAEVGEEDGQAEGKKIQMKQMFTINCGAVLHCILFSVLPFFE